MITSSKCRPRNNAGRFFVTELPYQIAVPRLQQIPLLPLLLLVLRSGPILCERMASALGKNDPFVFG